MTTTTTTRPTAPLPERIPVLALLTRSARAAARRLTRRHPGPSPERLIAVEAALRDLGRRHHLAEAPQGEPWHAGVNYGDPSQDPIGMTRYQHPDAWPWTKTGPDRWVSLTEQPWRADDEVRTLLPGTQLRRRPARPPWPKDAQRAAQAESHGCGSPDPRDDGSGAQRDNQGAGTGGAA